MRCGLEGGARGFDVGVWMLCGFVDVRDSGEALFCQESSIARDFFLEWIASPVSLVCGSVNFRTRSLVSSPWDLDPAFSVCERVVLLQFLLSGIYREGLSFFQFEIVT